ncbi:uncharacterized protein LOC124441289 [Xenia sp. Carnegie-2017]|uniref:uncharacterized protein LOC124441289 n=1 Tax=Xenia sp. Carnegie-2017 TaxID=2897299 RepID=UPI001F03B79C|nr:uncharacterized protein LOC124441289 [Xenia sp. Carnegie-2017]
MRNLVILQFVQWLYFVVHVVAALNTQEEISKNHILLDLNNVQAVEQPDECQESNVSFKGKSFNPTLSLDERCEQGLPLSVRWTNYGPYSSLVNCSNNGSNKTLLKGIIADVINDMLPTCCHKDSKVVYGRYIRTFEELVSLESKYQHEDIMFPISFQNTEISEFKGLPVVQLLTAPKTTLLVPEINKKGKIFVLFRTVALAWPMLIFIFLAAIISGMSMWLLDLIRFTRPLEFPTKFTDGVWEGFWWAVVTMTTVGYGDRAPRFFIGRVFCIIWILIGMSIIAIFTAMVTASLYASIQYQLIIHGSVMGTVGASQEEMIGTGMNANVKRFKTPNEVIETLVEKSELDMVIMDSYLLSFYHEIIKEKPVRIKDHLEQPINYGFVLSKGSENFTQCFRAYVKNYPQKIFKSIRDNIHPLKNPTDETSEELLASQDLLREGTFKKILGIMAGVIGAIFIAGIVWEFIISKFLYKNANNQKKKNRSRILQALVGSRLAQYTNKRRENEMQQIEVIRQKTTKIRQLIADFDDFYKTWFEQLKQVTEDDEIEWGDFGEKSKDSNMLTIAYDGNKNGSPSSLLVNNDDVELG